jgi:hypothetical protein
MLDIVAPQQADQVPVGVRDEHALRARFGQVMGHFVHADIGPIRARGRIHHVFDRRLVRRLQSFAAHIAEHHTLIVYDDTQIGVQLADARTQTTCRHVSIGQCADARLTCQLALGR